MLWHPLALFRSALRDADQPMTITYYGPRQAPVDPRRTVRPGTRPHLTLVLGGLTTGTVLGPDEVAARARMVAAIQRWGWSA
ncbi:hypothetical protein [Streptomyces sp. NPDC088739]|uniref:hypothetical protein n=1 Tax=Streptomyces sp. NPDC088739 TaxID=3365882 RepID=UPI003819B4B8